MQRLSDMYINSIKCFFSQRICRSKQRLNPVRGFHWTRQHFLAGWIAWAFYVSSCYFRREVSLFVGLLRNFLDLCVQICRLTSGLGLRLGFAVTFVIYGLVSQPKQIRLFPSCSLHWILVNLHQEISRRWSTSFCTSTCDMVAFGTIGTNKSGRTETTTKAKTCANTLF